MGATGSVGASALAVIAKHPERFSVFALGANTNAAAMAELCIKFSPRFVVMADPDAASKLRNLLATSELSTEILSGNKALDQIVSHVDVDIVVAAIVGAAGLASTLAAARAGKKILLANKESLVIAGQYLLNAVHENNAQLIPLDSEHNAIFQCHPVSVGKVPIGLPEKSVARILLTASGGPFLDRALNTFTSITPEQACAHPRWNMGRKISVDSATMMNKGLEYIEACILFGLQPEQIDVVIHPQSIVHSMVEYIDGSILAQLGSTDMRIPIAQALAYPERISSGVQSLSIADMARLEFQEPSDQRFPALQLAKEAASEGEVLPVVMNAANEICVKAFLQNQIGFLQITQTVADVMKSLRSESVSSFSDIMELDQATRVATQALIV